MQQDFDLGELVGELFAGVLVIWLHSGIDGGVVCCGIACFVRAHSQGGSSRVCCGKNRMSNGMEEIAVSGRSLYVVGWWLCCCCFQNGDV